MRRCPWCQGYRRRNQTRRHEFKSWTDCISHSTNIFGKGMNPNIPPPATGKQQGRLGSSALVRLLVQGKENSEFKPVKLRLKIDLVSYPARAEGLGKYGKEYACNLQNTFRLIGHALTMISQFGITCVVLFTNPSALAGYDTRSIFKQSLTGLNSEFSFSQTSCLTKAEEPSLPQGE